MIVVENETETRNRIAGLLKDAEFGSLWRLRNGAVVSFVGHIDAIPGIIFQMFHQDEPDQRDYGSVLRAFATSRNASWNVDGTRDDSVAYDIIAGADEPFRIDAYAVVHADGMNFFIRPDFAEDHAKKSTINGVVIPLSGAFNPKEKADA
jgi:hypothetical protein